jgi:hypothetical protein
MRLLAGIAWYLLLAAGLAAAQEPVRAPEPPRSLVPDKSPAERATTARPVEEVEPSLYYLKDKAGQLQAVPGFNFETFVELYKLKNQLTEAEAKPAFALEQLTVEGAAAGDRAQLTVRVRIHTEDSRWIRVPLRLDQAMLRSPSQYEGRGKHFVYYQPGEGYVVWVDGQGDRQHVVTLKLLVPLVDLGGATRLKLFLPRAAASELRVAVAVAGAAATCSEGKLSSEPALDDAGTELVVQGATGDFELSWRAPEVKTSERTAALEVVGAILTRIDGRTIDSEATLNVRSYGESFDRFRVRLPRDAELVPRAGTSYTVVAWEPTDPAGMRMAEVRLAQPTAGPVEVQLATRRRYDGTKSDQWLELNGFEVAEASRQWGHLAVAVVGDWHVLWGPSRGMRRVDQWPESLRYEDVVAGYEYFAQPASLTARLVARKTHLGVEPEYLLLVEPDQVKLEAKLRYTIRGAKAFKLDVRLGPWQFDSVEPDYLVAADAVTVSANQMLSLPLQQPSTGQVELTLRAHQPIAAGTGKLNVSLPQPQANSLGPAALVVVAADNLELVPDSDVMAGLARQQVRPSMPLPERQQPPLFYRGDTSKAVFAASLAVHPRAVNVDVNSQVALTSKEAQVEQRLSYGIAYEPLDRLVLEVPRGLSPDKFAFQIDGQSLPPVVLGEPAGASGPTRIAVTLPRSYLGSCELTVKHAFDVSLAGGSRTAVNVPLVMPAEGNLQANKLTVTGPPEMAAETTDRNWTPVPEESQRSKLVLSVASRAGGATLAVTMQQRTAAPATVVERLWMQTVLTDPDRQDRAVFRVTTDQKELRVGLPAGASQGSVVLFVDGQPETALVAEPGLIVVTLTKPAAEHVVDMRYHFPAPPATRGRLSLEAPQIGSEVWTRRVYWQLVFPRNEHAVLLPAGFTREYTWGWCDYFWGRRPLLEQAELETWVGAAHETSVSEDSNRYLLSAMGKVDVCSVHTAARTTIVLAASGLALLAGLLLIHVPAVRHPSLLLVAGVGLLAGGAVFPEAMLLVAQAAALGVTLAILAGLVELGLGRRRPRQGRTKAVAEKGSTQVYRASAAGAGQASTQSAPRAAPPASLEWDV